MFAIGLVGIQLIRPSRTNPPIDPAKTIEASGVLTPEVKALLDHSCKNCHSYETVWPWYSNVAPMSWVVASDVSRGRSHLSLSTWANYDARTANKKMLDMCEQLEMGEMPPTIYTMVHTDATITPEDTRIICAW